MSMHRCDRYTELGPYIAWLCKINDGEYTIVIQIADHPPECADHPFETEEQALRAADVFAHQLQEAVRGAAASQASPEVLLQSRKELDAGLSDKGL